MAAHVDDFLNSACDNPFQKHLVLRIWESKSAGYFRTRDFWKSHKVTGIPHIEPTKQQGGRL